MNTSARTADISHFGHFWSENDQNVTFYSIFFPLLLLRKWKMDPSGCACELCGVNAVCTGQLGPGGKR